MRSFLILLGLLLRPQTILCHYNSSEYESTLEDSTAMSVCLHDSTTLYDESRHERTYKIGVLAHRGEEAAYSEFNCTFNDYLTATAGQMFNPPISFEMKPLNYTAIFTDSKEGIVDFIYVNPSAFSCIESEFQAHSLVSQVSLRKINGNDYHLKMFAGVILTRADNKQIHTIQDLKEKTMLLAP